ncbi:anti-sigma-factor antagonist [Caldithrix abyssi DSM 13497]|uniref:Anti-sigma factor antagonist n=2 Tax=Caldithrix abyssi DSM 13497 TaxID=880073 RepID=A0A1J1C8A0_CALAY|nr:anti-sigma-factor antagonist [Caldithrix abyssi DSM 13497]
MNIIFKKVKLQTIIKPETIEDSDMNFPTQFMLNGEVVVIDIPRRLTSEISGELKKLMKELLAQEKYKIVMNLEKTRYMDSSGLGAIVSKIAATRTHGGDIRLAAPQQTIIDLLELTHINQIVKIFDSVEEAVKSFEE